jgi:hypothetical protein
MGGHAVRFAMAVLVLGFSAGAGFADPPAFLELTVLDKIERGKLVAMDQSTAWVMARDGRLSELAVEDIKSFRRLTPRFQPFSSAQLRDALRREFGKDFEVAGSEHYLVCAPPGKAREYAQLFEEIYRTFHGYFSVRGFRMSPPEFPLVAIVFPDHKSFDDYCKRDELRAFPGLMGYYLRASNRVALFDPAGSKTSSTGTELNTASRMDAAIEADLASTIVHEATHQVAFNTGLHSRIGETPKWIIEGLATVFESPGVRASASARGRAFHRINRDRYLWFQSYAQSRRKPKSLAAFVSADYKFQSSALDAYAEAWALSFYLIETRPSKYAQYLKTIATRDPLKAYSKEERLDDFQKAFGNDLEMLEADFLRFISRLEE